MEHMKGLLKRVRLTELIKVIKKYKSIFHIFVTLVFTERSS